MVRALDLERSFCDRDRNALLLNATDTVVYAKHGQGGFTGGPKPALRSPRLIPRRHSHHTDWLHHKPDRDTEGKLERCGH